MGPLQLTAHLGPERHGLFQNQLGALDVDLRRISGESRRRLNMDVALRASASPRPDGVAS
jgi:hypothetical protein